MEPLTFSHHPARRQPLGTGLVLAMLGLIAWAAYGTLHEVSTTVVLMLAYVAYMASFLFPSAYRFSPEGVELTRLGVTQRFAWNRFRRFSVHRGGVFLAPVSRAHVVDALRGVYLVMDPQQRALIQPYLDAYVR